ncbi:MAG: hypothetical protein AABZ24_07425, partial [Nitrospirota bacterium]
MTFELLGRVHKELSITGHAFYETILSISELVNRKVQIIRLHWQASTLLQRIDDVTAEVGQQIVVQVSDRLQNQSHPDSVVGVIDQTLADAISRVQELKQTLIGVDAEIRELKIETVHQELLSLQQDLALRSGGIERLTVVRVERLTERLVADRVRAEPDRAVPQHDVEPARELPAELLRQV